MAMLLLISLIAACICILLYAFQRVRSLKRPPGPPGWPIIGNLLSLPKDLLFLRLEEWSKQYGPLYYISIGSQPAIVLSSIKVAGDVLDRMSSVTSDRAPAIKAHEFYERNLDIGFMGRDEKWRAGRRAIHANLNLRVARTFYALQEEEATYMLLEILNSGNGHERPISDHTHRFAGSIIYRALYGGPIIRLDGPDPSKVQERLTRELFAAANPSRSIVDLMPFLKPIIARSSFLRRESDAFYSTALREYTNAFEAAGQDQMSSIRLPIAQDLELNGDQYGLTRPLAIFTAGLLFRAGQETVCSFVTLPHPGGTVFSLIRQTNTSLLWFVLAMVLHPQVVEAAHKQLDSVVGKRPPSFADRERLPLIEAIIKEVFRWRPPTPLSVSHVASEDLEYQGYTIRKGTLLIDNIWAQTRDPSVYANPHTFDPSRFLDEKGQPMPAIPDTHGDMSTFGRGRRICPGRDFAFNSMWIGIASLLWAFRFDKAIGEDGKEVNPDPSNLCDFFISVQPAPYKVNLVPRRQDLLEGLQNMLKAMD